MGNTREEAPVAGVAEKLRIIHGISKREIWLPVSTALVPAMGRTRRFLQFHPQWRKNQPIYGGKEAGTTWDILLDRSGATSATVC